MDWLPSLLALLLISGIDAHRPTEPTLTTNILLSQELQDISCIPDCPATLMQNFNCRNELLARNSYDKLSTLQDTWILGVVSKQLRLLHDRVEDSTTSVNSLSHQISELVEDAVASWCGDIVGHFWLIRNGLQNLSSSNLNFSVLTLSMSLRYFGNELYKRGPNTVISYYIFLKGFCWVSVC